MSASDKSGEGGEALAAGEVEALRPRARGRVLN